MLNLPQGAPETKLLMVLAFLRLRQGPPGTRENRKLTQLLEGLQKKYFMKKSLEFNFQEPAALGKTCSNRRRQTISY